MIQRASPITGKVYTRSRSERWDPKRLPAETGTSSGISATARAITREWSVTRYCSVRASDPTAGIAPHHGSGPR